MIDGMESSHHNFADPTALTFEYMQYMQAVLRGEIPAPSRGGSTRGRPRVLHIGAAGCTMARAVHAEWPGSHQVAIETDEILAARVRERSEEQTSELQSSGHIVCRLLLE